MHFVVNLKRPNNPNPKKSNSKIGHNLWFIHTMDIYFVAKASDYRYSTFILNVFIFL